MHISYMTTTNNTDDRLTALENSLAETRQWVGDVEEMHGRLEDRIAMQQAGLRLAALDPPAGLDAVGTLR